MTEELDRVKSALADRYRIERIIGSGGMATVYLAEDVKHHRPVAVKVFRPELAVVLGAQRFLREIDIAARLTHPHILPLHDSGEADGFLFYVMPYVEGESLRHRLGGEKKLPLEDALRIAREVAGALDYAHRQDIVHRDIKPENILLEEGHAVVVDFGIARAISAAVGERVTRPGTAIGTPAYMSPEQAMGERNLDGRTDVFSLGCVLCEMVLGQLPTGPAERKAITEGRVPDSITAQLGPLQSAPHAVIQILARALAQDPDDRYATAGDFAQALGATGDGGPMTWWGMLPRGGRAVVGGLATVAVLAVLLAPGWLLLDRRSGGAVPGSDRPMLVVLPFDNLGPPEDEYFADGVTDAITARLAGLGSLRVISRTSALQYEDADLTSRQIGEELRVDYILEGTVQRERPTDPTSRVRVIPLLIRVSDDTHLWATTYDEDLTRIFEVQSDIADRVAQAMDIALGPELSSRGIGPTRNVAAYEYYLRGQDYLWDKGWIAQDANALQIAIGMFERAIALDSSFALAYAQLSNAHRALFRGMIDPSEARLAQARAAVDRALELQPDLPEAHLALGMYYYASPMPDHARALQELERVAQHKPNDALARELIATLQAARGAWDSALENAQWAADLDPRSPGRLGFAGWMHLLVRRYSDAEAFFDRVLAIAPDDGATHPNRIFLYQGWTGDQERVRAAAEEMERNAEPAVTAMALVQAARMLVADGAYDAVFEQLTPASYARTFPFNYFYVKAEFHRLRDQAGRARAYSDSLLRALAEPSEERAADPNLTWYLAYAYAGLGRREDAVRQAERTLALLAASGDALQAAYMQHNLIRVYALVGEYDAAVDQIEFLLSVPSLISVPYLRAERFPGTLSGHPRFRRLLEQGG